MPNLRCSQVSLLSQSKITSPLIECTEDLQYHAWDAFYDHTKACYSGLRTLSWTLASSISPVKQKSDSKTTKILGMLPGYREQREASDQSDSDLHHSSEDSIDEWMYKWDSCIDETVLVASEITLTGKLQFTVGIWIIMGHFSQQECCPIYREIIVIDYDLYWVLLCSCFASPIQRAWQFAEIVWADRDGPLIPMSNLKEAHLGWLQGMKQGKL